MTRSISLLSGPGLVTAAHLFATMAAGLTTAPQMAEAADRAPDVGGAGVTVFQRSAYTTIELAKCKATKSEFGTRYLCGGLPGYSVYFAEGDLRAFVAASTSPVKSRAAEQTLKAFNTPFNGQSKRAPVEWRISIRDGKPVPYAAIIKFYTTLAAARGEVLVVMKIAGAETCHVAYIDAAASNDAIVLARQIADERASKFDCRSDPEVVGVKGKSPM